MVDTFRPLQVADAVLELEDEDYMASFYAPRAVRAKAS